MSEPITLEISEPLYRAAQQLAATTGRSVEQVFVETLEASLPSLEDAITEAQIWSYTQKQGQYLAFIHQYTKLHGEAPAEADMQYYFRTSPPNVHQMVVRLAERGLISRIPGQARSIRVLVPPDRLPDLE